MKIIPEMKKRAQMLETIAGRKTIHKVLTVKEPPTVELVRLGYFYRIIEASELFS